MMNSLTCIFTAVGDDAETVIQTFLLCDYRNSLKTFCGISCVFGVYLTDRGNVLFGDNQNMHGRLRSDVAESENILCLINLVGGDVPCDYFTEKAIIHFRYLLTKLGSYKIVNSSKSIVKLENILTAAHCRVGLAAATAAAELCYVLDDVACLNTLCDCVFTAGSQECDFVVVNCSENSNNVCVLVAEVVAQLAELA